MSNFHRDALPGDIHVVYQFTYANAAARLAAVLTSDDIGKIARQTDNESYWILKDDSPLTWQNLGAGSGSGGINYIENYDLESDASGYVTYADGAAAPVDGGGGSPTLTAVRSTSSPLRGSASLLLTPGALGNGVAYAFTIARADFARMIKVSFDYEIGTPASYTDGDIGIFVISASDSGFTTNLEVQQLAPYKLMKALGQETFEGVFQSHASNLYYRICIHQITAATGYTLKIDNVLVGPGSVVYGAPVGDWKEFTPTGSLTTNVTYSGRYRRVGEMAEFKVRILASGAPNVTNISINLPPGLTMDNSKRVFGTQPGESLILGYGTVGDAFTRSFSLMVAYKDATSVYLTKAEIYSSFVVRHDPQTTTSPFSLNTGDNIEAFFSVPILGWSSTVEMSNDSDTRVVAAVYSGAASSTVSAGNPILFNTKRIDTHAAYNSGTGLFTVPVKGQYRVSIAGMYQSSGGTQLDIYKNGSTYHQYFYGLSSSFIGGASAIVDCNAGDTISVVNVSGTTVLSTSVPTPVLSIERISGPAQIAASEFVGADYTMSSAAVTSGDPINYANKIYDTHGAVTTGASWKFTAPGVGYYQVCGVNWTSSATPNIRIFKNGVANRYLDALSTSIKSYATTIYLLAGDYIDIRPDANASMTIGTDGSRISISKIN
jgi:hypothetical protein